MKRITALILALLLAAALVPSTAFAAGESFDLYITYDKEFYEIGETVTAQVHLDRKDSADAYNMAYFTAAVLFNPLYLKYVDSSQNSNNAKSFIIGSSTTYYNANYQNIGINFNNMGSQMSYPATQVVAELTFTALANVKAAPMMFYGQSVSLSVGSTATVNAVNGVYYVGDPNAVYYRVSFSGGDGAAGTAPVVEDTLESGSFALPANPYFKTGHSFAGWSDGKALYQPADAYVMPASDVTFTAQWTKDPVLYTVSFFGGADATGEPPSARRLYEGDTLALPTKNTLVAENSKFLGWSWQGVNYNPGDIFSMPEGDVIFVAAWEEIELPKEPENPDKPSEPEKPDTPVVTPTYIVMFDSSGGTGPMPSSIQLKSGESFSLPTAAFAKEGFSFGGWICNGTVYYPGASVKMPSANLVFAAAWVPVEYSTAPLDSAIDSSTPTVTPDVPDFALNQPAIGQYTITFASGGGSGDAPVMAALAAGENFALPKNTFVRDGYTFMTWSDGQTTYVPGSSYTMPARHVTFTAVWLGSDGSLSTVGPDPAQTAEPSVKPDEELPAVVIGETVYNNPFVDITASDWYYEDVIIAYNQGLVNGKTNSTYVPADTLRLSEAVKLAACMHQLNATGSVTLQNSADGKWYQTYVDYAIENGIISPQFEDYEAAATRAEFAAIFASALPEASFAPINSVSDNAVPDVSMDMPDSAAIYKLYRAGILTGYEDGGSFRPNNTILRSEVAAILTRMMNDSARKTLTLG